MANQIILKNKEVDPQWINYIKIESEALSKLNDFEISNYADRELFNPEFQTMLEELQDDSMESSILQPFSLSYSEAYASKSLAGLFGKFKRLKERIRKIICEILGSVGNGETPSWEDIIRTVLLAVAGSIFGGAIGAVVLPIIIAFLAKIIRRGIESVCPV